MEGLRGTSEIQFVIIKSSNWERQFDRHISLIIISIQYVKLVFTKA